MFIPSRETHLFQKAHDTHGLFLSLGSFGPIGFSDRRLGARRGRLPCLEAESPSRGLGVLGVGTRTPNWNQTEASPPLLGDMFDLTVFGADRK